MREILGITKVVKRETAVGQDEMRTLVEDAAHDHPLSRHGLTRTVDVRIPEVRCLGLMLEQRLFGQHDAEALRIDRFVENEWPVGRRRHRHSVRLEGKRVHVAAQRGQPPDRDEAPYPAL